MTIDYTVGYGIGADSQEQGPGDGAAEYLAGKDGMAKWTYGGVAVPSR